MVALRPYLAFSDGSLQSSLGTAAAYREFKCRLITRPARHSSRFGQVAWHGQLFRGEFFSTVSENSKYMMALCSFVARGLAHTKPVEHVLAL